MDEHRNEHLPQETPREGDVVRLRYTFRLADGSVCGSSKDGELLEFEVGGGDVIPGLDDAVREMLPAESRTVEIPAARAYGRYRENQQIEVERERLPADLELEAGQRVELSNEGAVAIITVKEVREASVVFDTNHPLAGEDLTFDLELAEIVRGES